MGGSTSKKALADYTYTVPGSASPAEGLGAIHRNPEFKNDPSTYAYVYEDGKTLYDLFQRGVRMSGTLPCMGFRPVDAEGKAGAFQWLTYNECWAKAQAIGAAMRNMDLAPLTGSTDAAAAGEGAAAAASSKVEEDAGEAAGEEAPPMRLVGIFCKNRYEWVIVEQACNAYSGVVVPLYDTLGESAVTYVLNQTGIRTVFCSTEEVPKLLAAKKDHAAELTKFTTIVQFEDVTEEARAAAAAGKITLRSFSELLDNGRASPVPVEPPSPKSIATFCYTSGTTGNPKGAMLTHENIVADCAAAVRAGVVLNQDDRHLSYLPLAHMFERLVEAAVWQAGAAVGFYQGDPKKITADLAELRPTLFPSVPRLFNKIYDKISAGTSSGLVGSLFARGFAAKKYYLARGDLKYGFWDGLVFDKISKRLGLDRCRIMLTGSAPISAHVMDFLRIVFSCPVLEGYGQTESAAAATVTPLGDQATAGHVGVPLACNDVRLVSVDEMGYLVTDEVHGKGDAAIPCNGRGEICFRGPNVFAGYYKNAKKTAEAVDADGWLHSGDIGIWLKNGYLKIVDRKKNIFKLSQGEYIAAEKIENIYISSPFIAQAFVYGDSMQSCLVAILVPDEEYLEAWKADNEAMAGMSHADLCADESFRKLVFDDITRVGKEAKLHSFERAKAIHLEPELWSVENEVLTPTFKLKRKTAKEKYQSIIDGLYASLGDKALVAGKAGVKQDSHS